MAPPVSDYRQPGLPLPKRHLYLSMKYYLQIVDSFIFASHHCCKQFSMGKKNNSRIKRRYSFIHFSWIKIFFNVLKVVYVHSVYSFKQNVMLTVDSACGFAGGLSAW